MDLSKPTFADNEKIEKKLAHIQLNFDLPYLCLKKLDKRNCKKKIKLKIRH